MKVEDIMTRSVACCMPDTKLNQIARMMVEHDCGEIPITDGLGRLIGVVTDRDICCRAVAHGLDPWETSASEVMTSPVIFASPHTGVEECARMMEEYMIRRLPISDEQGFCCGIISQADLARRSDGLGEELVKEVSRPTNSASNVGTG